MSGTEYAGQHTLRLDDADRHALSLAVMRDIVYTSTHPPEDEIGAARHLRRLRSLLERLTD
jgi:hypothetical protein